ncbi:glycosyltransferase family 4 protein [Methylophaga sp. TMB456]|nr:glycosyltransferase family 4 protein [Methylophaga pinxianii]
MFKDMKISFVLPALNLTGGVRVVGIYSKLLSERGHNVTILYPKPLKLTIKKKIKKLINLFLWKSEINKPRCPYFDHGLAKVKSLSFHSGVIAEEIPDADIVIATFWNTAEWVAKMPDSKGIKYYFIQHYELHPWLPVDRVKATFQLPFKRIVVSPWIADCLRDYEGCEIDALVLNGVDTNQFFSVARMKQTQMTVGFMYSPRRYKGCQIAIEAIIAVKQKCPDLRVLVFGSQLASEEIPLPEFVEFHLNPEQSKIKDIYSQCDAWLFSSIKEGFGLPILEAMACGTPVIGTPAGAATSIINSENGVLLDDYSASKTADAILSISNLTEHEWLNMSIRAIETAKLYSWENAVIEFENAINL